MHFSARIILALETTMFPFSNCLYNPTTVWKYNPADPKCFTKGFILCFTSYQPPPRQVTLDSETQIPCPLFPAISSVFANDCLETCPQRSYDLSQLSFGNHCSMQSHIISAQQQPSNLDDGMLASLQSRWQWKKQHMMAISQVCTPEGGKNTQKLHFSDAWYV